MCVSCELLDFLSPCDVYEAHDAAHAFLKYLYARITKNERCYINVWYSGSREELLLQISREFSSKFRFPINSALLR